MTSQATTVFGFSTKARNLAQLEGRLRWGCVLGQIVVPVREWTTARDLWVAEVMKRFPEGLLIARSSAPSEDSVECSLAGAFDSRGYIPAGDAGAISAAIDEVIASYALRDGADLREHEVLVQPMVRDVCASGVVFTRDLERNSPYYILNYDESDRTDTITAGTAKAHRVVRIFRQAEPSSLDPLLKDVVALARELEQITGSDALDIEFAVDRQGTVYVLQVRPLTRTRIVSFLSLDARIASEIRAAKDFVRSKSARRANLFGETTVLGEMPDWNPAEMIGTQPKPLAMSLYRHLILKSTWREARELVGYRQPFPYHLLLEVAGRPYIDVRCSFNSFLPATLPDAICEKVVNYYTARLQAHPELHDKIEFEVVVSSLSFDFDVHGQRLRAAGFTHSEVADIRAALRTLTDNVVKDATGVLRRLEEDVAKLEPRRRAGLAAASRPADLPIAVEQLVEDCARYGTLPFSVFARCAFIATSFLRGLVNRGVWTPAQFDAFVHSIETVAGAFVTDLNACREGTLEPAGFLARYGHLRPGTYDINAPTYAERPDVYLGVPAVANDAAPAATATWAVSSRRLPSLDADITPLLAECGFTFGPETLSRFIVRSIQLREAVKFEFTKNLSAVLSLLGEFGRYHGLSREDVAFVPIDAFLELANRNISSDWLDGVRDAIDRNRKRYELTSAIYLPDLIFSGRDLDVVSLQARKPNFITQKRVAAPRCTLTADTTLQRAEEVTGRVVLIENADPGYDWLFTKGIAGLVTKYGGAASHMTIRCAEFGLPAAIGCGEQIFGELAASDWVLLDCAARQVKPYVA